MKRRFIVTFGRKQPDAALLQRFVAYRQATDMTGIAAFETGATPPFRLCDDDGRRFPPSFLADLPDTARKLARLKADTSRDFDLFAKNPRRLLDIYFDFIAVRLAAEAPALERSFGRSAGCSASRTGPFPRSGPCRMPRYSTRTIRRPPPPILLHDLAFWTGEAVLTIRLRGSGTPSPREAAACDRLRALGVQIVTIPMPELATGIALFSPERFPAAFRSFWQGAPYPCSPFRPQGLTRTLVLD